MSDFDDDSDPFVGQSVGLRVPLQPVPGHRPFCFREDATGMAKRSAKSTAAQTRGDNLHHLAPHWDPIDGQRDQSYVRRIRPLSDNQRQLMQAIDTHTVTVALGPAGTGKTYLAINAAVEALEDGACARIVLSRPAIEAGEHLGFLPGTMEEKVMPYLRPLYDSLSDRLGGKRLKTMIAEGGIEIAPIAYMRGRTLNNAFVIIDEAQNCTYGQIKMLLTRLGWHSTMVITGDPDQTDLLDGLSGLAAIADKLAGTEGVAVVRMGPEDVVRHPLVASMLGVL